MVSGFCPGILEWWPKSILPCPLYKTGVSLWMISVFRFVIPPRRHLNNDQFNFDCYLRSSQFLVLAGPPPFKQILSVGKMKQDIMEAKEGSANRGIFAVKLCDIVCGSGRTVL